jgi:hypothetical protein
MKREGKSGKGLNILRNVRLQEIVKPGQLVQLGTELTTGKMMMTLRTALSVEVKRRQRLRELRGEDICHKPHRSKLALFIRESSGSLLSKNCRAFYSDTSLALFALIPPQEYIEQYFFALAIHVARGVNILLKINKTLGFLFSGLPRILLSRSVVNFVRNCEDLVFI